MNSWCPLALPPVTGTADVEVVQVSTGQVLGAGSVPMNAVSPAIFCIASGGCFLTGGLYQAAVINADNTVNSSSNPAARGSVIAIYCYRSGRREQRARRWRRRSRAHRRISRPRRRRPAWPSEPVSSTTAGPSWPATRPTAPWVTYSGLAPGYAGLWQINVQIPMAVAARRADAHRHSVQWRRQRQPQLGLPSHHRREITSSAHGVAKEPVDSAEAPAPLARQCGAGLRL